MAIEFSKNYLVDRLNDGFSFFKNNSKLVLSYLGAGVALLGVFAGYFYYRIGLERRAQRDLVTALALYNSKVIKSVTDEELGENEFKSEADKWTAVNLKFEELYRKNSSAGIASFFLAYRVDALLNLNKLTDAIEVQEELIRKLPKQSALKPYNIIKLSLMKIDTNVESKVDEGLSELKRFAYDSGNVVQDAALYHLGQYYFYEKNFKEAVNYWNQLMINFDKNIEYPSIWVDLAKPKLKTIVV